MASIRFKNTLLLASAFLMLGTITLAQDDQPLQPPEGVPQGSDWLYRQHYAQIQKIMEDPDVGSRERRLTAYAKQLQQENKILEHMEGFFGQIVQAYNQAGQAREAQALTEKMIAMFPDSLATKGTLFQRAFQAGDHANAIKFGESIYKASPSTQLAYMLAQSYGATNNVPKIREFAHILVNELGAKAAISYVVWLANHYGSQQDIAKSLEFYNTVLQAFPSGVPEGWKPDDWNATKATAYSVRATVAYQNKDYNSAIAAYQQVVSLTPENDVAYYYLGLSFWNLERVDDAKSALAKAVVLGKTSADKAREQLLKLAPSGIEELLQQARQEFNL